MNTNESRQILKRYLARELPLDVAADHLAKLYAEGWYLYSNPDSGTAEARDLLEALDRRVKELVATWREIQGEGPPPGTT